MVKINYLDAIFADETSFVVIGGKQQAVKRATFGLHLRLGSISAAIMAAKSPGERVRLIGEYLRAAGVSSVASANGIETITAYAELLLLNHIDGSLPFMDGGGEKSDPPPYDYPGRVWAVWVHMLASRYGWTRDYIFSLSPEEVICYVQEIMLSEATELDVQRSLSELSYKYDPNSKTSRFIPTPRPAWMMEPTGDAAREKRPRRLNKSMLPVGKVIDLSGMGTIDGNAADTSND